MPECHERDSEQDVAARAVVVRRERPHDPVGISTTARESAAPNSTEPRLGKRPGERDHDLPVNEAIQVATIRGLRCVPVALRYPRESGTAQRDVVMVPTASVSNAVTHLRPHHASPFRRDECLGEIYVVADHHHRVPRLVVGSVLAANRGWSVRRVRDRFKIEVGHFFLFAKRRSVRRTPRLTGGHGRRGVSEGAVGSLSDVWRGLSDLCRRLP